MSAGPDVRGLYAELARRTDDPVKREHWGSVIRFLRREYNRRDRHDARADLCEGVEPEPRQPRGRAIWDAY